jgi:predicted N-formylglutamate amidohydrolase
MGAWDRFWELAGPAPGELMGRTQSAEAPEPAVAVERARGSSPIVLVCDHASNRLPARYGDLGLSADDLTEHFAWDPGALEVSRHLAEILDAPLVYGCVSRLALDVNRDPADPDSIVKRCEGKPVPGNLGLPASERRRRAAEIYEPFHAAVAELLRGRAQRGQPSALAGIHTFTRRLNGVARPWDCGVIFADDHRMGEAVVSALRRDGDLLVGVNEPYAPSDRVYHTMHRHGDARGLPTAMIEIRNDLVVGAGEQRGWAERLAGALREAAETALASEGTA